jgi:hypothetical protein
VYIAQVTKLHFWECATGSAGSRCPMPRSPNSTRHPGSKDDGFCEGFRMPAARGPCRAVRRPAHTCRPSRTPQPPTARAVYPTPTMPAVTISAAITAASANSARIPPSNGRTPIFLRCEICVMPFGPCWRINQPRCFQFPPCLIFRSKNCLRLLERHSIPIALAAGKLERDAPKPRLLARPRRQPGGCARPRDRRR